MPLSEEQEISSHTIFCASSTFNLKLIIVFLLQPVHLRGHSSQITALCFGHMVNPTHLCSASADSIFLWATEQSILDYKTGVYILSCFENEFITWRVDEGSVILISFDCSTYVY